MIRAKPMSPDDRREAIIAATTDLVLEHGPAATTRQIADACGIAEGTLFRVFESKDDILDAVVEHLMDPSFLIAEIEAIPVDGDVVDIVRELAATIGIATTRIRSVMMALHTAQTAMESRRSHHGPRDKTKFVEDQVAIAAAISGVLSSHSHQLRVDPEIAASFIRTTVFASNLPGLPQLTEPDVFTDLLVHALVKEPACITTH